jgi:serine protease Do
MTTLRTLLAACLAGSVLASPALAQGVIEPPAEGEAIAPQPPTSTTIERDAAGVPAASAQPRMQGPASVADLAEGLLDAVVNISTSQNVPAAGRGLPPLDAPDGSPLQDFFDELLREDGNASRSVQSLGSGFVIDESGIVVTNNHVIADADEITVNFADGHRLEATVVGVDPATDIAVLQVEPDRPLTAVSFGRSDEVRIGDWVMAIGNPFGLGGSVTVGIVSARGRRITDGPYDDFIQTDAAINRGNSGGPLFDMYGRVVGINTAIISPTGGSIGIGFSIPAQLAENVIGQLREFGETRRGWLGIRLQAVTEEIAEGLGLPEARGALVMGVVPNGPSDGGSIEVGDVIVGFDGREVETSRDLPRIVAETPVGRTVTIELLRKENADAPVEERTAEITLGRLEGNEQASTSEAEDGEPAEEVEEAPARSPTLGMSLTDLTAELRERFSIADNVNGVVVEEVDPDSSAAEEGIEAGLVIVEIAQESVDSADAVRTRLGELRESGQRSALILVSEGNGDLRFVVVPLD